jgi:Spy/CpxP family protein refolding chaperone
MTRRVLFTVTARVTLVAALLLSFKGSFAQDSLKNKAANLPGNPRVNPTESELTRSRTDVIQKIKETRAGAEKLLALHEAEQQRLAEEYERRRELYYQGLIARKDVLDAEQVLAEAMARVEEDKRWLAETDAAITEASMRDELLRLPGLAIGGYRETPMLLRFNGAALWSLVDAPKIEAFFTHTFGHALPISALGQTATHDRLHLDHHNAMDVALHPDSAEGQALLNYLRQAGIPFMAFRGAVSGAATGAHIHIGKPSPVIGKSGLSSGGKAISNGPVSKSALRKGQ